MNRNKYNNKSKYSDVIVIGGGIIGLFSAYYLTKAGRSVRIIEKEKVGSGASHGNCGLLFFSDLLPLCTPGVVPLELIKLLKGKSSLHIKPGADISMWKFLYKFFRYGNEKHMKHAVEARSDILGLSEVLFDVFFQKHNPCEWEHKGVLIVCREKQGLLQYGKTNDLLRPFGLEAHVLSKQELLAEEPTLKENIAGGYYHSADSHLKPDLLVNFLKEYLKTQNVMFEENCHLKDFQVKNTEIAGVSTSKGEFCADNFVIAAGAWSGLILNGMGISIPVQPGKGYSITMRRPSPCPALPCYLYESNVVATPFQSGYRLGGTMEFSGFNLDLNQKRLAKIKKAAQQYLKKPFGSLVTEEWTSLRPMCADDLPIISWLPGKENTVVATGHGMMGVTMGTGTGKLVSEMVCGLKPDIEIKPFSIKRFQV